MNYISNNSFSGVDIQPITPPNTGDTFYDINDETMKVFTGTEWVDMIGVISEKEMLWNECNNIEAENEPGEKHWCKNVRKFTYIK